MTYSCDGKIISEILTKDGKTYRSHDTLSVKIVVGWAKGTDGSIH